jgi:hypothetical protein
VICRRWFWPDGRVGARQRACSERACQKARRAQTQASWRRRNPDYFTARRIQTRRAVAEKGRGIELLRLPPPLLQLPWDIAQDEFGVAGADFLGHLGRVLVRVGQDARVAQLLVSTNEIGRHAPGVTQDQIPP